VTEPAHVRIVPATEGDRDLWRFTREVADILSGLPWVLVGGQMVALIEGEHGAPIGFATGDVDALVDVRAFSGVTTAAADRLLDAGFEPSLDGTRGYRFTRGDAIIDVLAPDHLGERADLRTRAARQHDRDHRWQPGPVSVASLAA
jgi:hypothetical protein